MNSDIQDLIDEEIDEDVFTFPMPAMPELKGLEELDESPPPVDTTEDAQLRYEFENVFNATLTVVEALWKVNVAHVDDCIRFLAVQSMFQFDKEKYKKQYENFLNGVFIQHFKWNGDKCVFEIPDSEVSVIFDCDCEYMNANIAKKAVGFNPIEYVSRFMPRTPSLAWIDLHNLVRDILHEVVHLWDHRSSSSRSGMEQTDFYESTYKMQYYFRDSEIKAIALEYVCVYKMQYPDARYPFVRDLYDFNSYQMRQDGAYDILPHLFGNPKFQELNPQAKEAHEKFVGFLRAFDALWTEEYTNRMKDFFRKIKIQ